MPILRYKKGHCSKHPLYGYGNSQTVGKERVSCRDVNSGFKYIHPVSEVQIMLKRVKTVQLVRNET